MTNHPLKLCLDSSLLDEELTELLKKRGHEVSVLPHDLFDVYIGFNAWRVPPMTPTSEVKKHVDAVIKQIRATKHVHNTETSVTPKRASTKPRKAPGRKRAAQVADTQAATATTPEGQSRSASDSPGTRTTEVTHG